MKLIFQFLALLENLLDQGEHHLQWCLTIWQDECFELVRRFHHVVDQWHSCLGEFAIHHTFVVDVKAHDMLVELPHRFADGILVVDELCDASQAFIN